MENPSSPHARRLLHQQVYKNARGKTPPWKEMYRKRCMERLRASRARLVDQFRGKCDSLNNNNYEESGKMVKDIMEIEWSAMKNSGSFRGAHVSHDNGSIDNEAALLQMMDQIQKELQDEEERMVAEVLNYDAASLASQVESLQSEEVICPICQVQVLQSSQSNLLISVAAAQAGSRPPGNMLVCGCGLALHGTNLTLTHVKSSIENVVTHHGQQCVGKLVFTQTTDTQGSNILATCQQCDWMSFLL